MWGVLSWFRGWALLLRQLEIPGKVKEIRTWGCGSRWTVMERVP